MLRVVAVHEGGFAWTLFGLVVLALALVAVALVIGSIALRRARRAEGAVRSLAAGGFTADARPAAGPLVSALSEGAEPEADEGTVPLEELEEPEPEAVAPEPEQVWEDEGGALPPHDLEEEAAASPSPPADVKEPFATPPTEAQRFEAPPMEAPAFEAPSFEAPPLEEPFPSLPAEPSPVAEEPEPSRGGRAATARPPPGGAGPLCECGHGREVHRMLSTQGQSICLGAVPPAPACRCGRFTPAAAAEADETARLVSLLRHEDQFVRIGAVARLRGRPEAEPALVRLLDDDAPLVRKEVVIALAESTGPAASRALMDVIVQDLSPDVRHAAVASLATLIQRRIPPSSDPSGN